MKQIGNFVLWVL